MSTLHPLQKYIVTHSQVINEQPLYVNILATGVAALVEGHLAKSIQIEGILLEVMFSTVWVEVFPGEIRGVPPVVVLGGLFAAIAHHVIDDIIIQGAYQVRELLTYKDGINWGEYIPTANLGNFTSSFLQCASKLSWLNCRQGEI